jgi:hypothetical protein
MTDAHRNTNEAVENKLKEQINKLQNKNWNVNINHRTPYKPQVEYYDEQTVIINGVQYQRVEPPKPQTLYEIIREWCDDDNGETCEEIVNKIEKEWLPTEVIEDGEDYNNGWNDCLKLMRLNLK